MIGRINRNLAAGLLGLGTLVLALVLVSGALASSASGPQFPSKDPFYSYGGSLKNVRPGTVLKKRQVTIVDDETGLPELGVTGEQLLYRTTTELGKPTITVATVIRPLVPSPNASKIVSYQTAYDALGPVCDPSYTLRGGNRSYSTAADEEQFLVQYAREEGYTVIVPDYESVHLDWAAGQESGYGTLDGIRATEQWLGLAQKSTPVTMVGYSGGSIATEFAAELQPKYANNLHIVGIAAGGIPAYFAHNLAYINGSSDWSGVIPAVLVGVSRAFNIDGARYESAYGRKVANQVSSECINNFLGAYPGLTIEKLLKRRYKDFFATRRFAKINNRLIMSRTGTPREPLFMGVGSADGTGDGVMVAADVESLAHTYCKRGVSVQFNEYKGSEFTHSDAAVPFETGALAFINQVLNGGKPTNGCSSITEGNSLAPLPTGPTNVEFRSLGLNHHGAGVVVKLRARHHRVSRVVLTLRHLESPVQTISIKRLTTAWHRVVLKIAGKTPARGYYTITVTRGQRIMLYRMLLLR
jgi:pimeloyl-ACP methyl ester carboxylesterase